MKKTPKTESTTPRYSVKLVSNDTLLKKGVQPRYVIWDNQEKARVGETSTNMKKLGDWVNAANAGKFVDQFSVEEKTMRTTLKKTAKAKATSTTKPTVTKTTKASTTTTKPEPPKSETEQALTPKELAKAKLEAKRKGKPEKAVIAAAVLAKQRAAEGKVDGAKTAKPKVVKPEIKLEAAPADKVEKFWSKLTEQFAPTRSIETFTDRYDKGDWKAHSKGIRYNKKDKTKIMISSTLKPFEAVANSLGLTIQRVKGSHSEFRLYKKGA